MRGSNARVEGFKISFAPEYAVANFYRLGEANGRIVGPAIQARTARVVAFLNFFAASVLRHVGTYRLLLMLGGVQVFETLVVGGNYGKRFSPTRLRSRFSQMSFIVSYEMPDASAKMDAPQTWPGFVTFLVGL